MDRLYERLLALLNTIASVWVLAMMAVIAADVIGRSAFNRPLFGIPEIVKVSVVGIVWLQMAYTLRADRHLRSNLVFGVLPPPLKRAVYALNCVAGITVFGLIVWHTYDEVLDTYRFGTFEGEHPVRIPVWPIWAILVLGASLTTIEFVVQLVKTLFYGHLPAGDEGAEDAGDGA